MIRTWEQLKTLLSGERSGNGRRDDLSSKTSMFTLLRDVIDSLGIITGFRDVTTVNVATYTMLDKDTVLLIDRAGVVAITLPASVSGRTIIIKDAGGNASQAIN